jgi:5-methyltetrahydrofolate--homocysteine methyltransferase
VKQVLRGLRQQTDKASQARDGNVFPNYCLLDFVALKRAVSPIGSAPLR